MKALPPDRKKTLFSSLHILSSPWYLYTILSEYLTVCCNRLNHIFINIKGNAKHNRVLTFSKNCVIFSAVFSAIIFILKVNNISTATKTRILQDPLITLSQTLQKNEKESLNINVVLICLFICKNSFCTITFFQIIFSE